MGGEAHLAGGLVAPQHADAAAVGDDRRDVVGAETARAVRREDERRPPAQVVAGRHRGVDVDLRALGPGDPEPPAGVAIHHQGLAGDIVDRDGEAGVEDVRARGGVPGVAAQECGLARHCRSAAGSAHVGGDVELACIPQDVGAAVGTLVDHHRGEDPGRRGGGPVVTSDAPARGRRVPHDRPPAAGVPPQLALRLLSRGTVPCTSRRRPTRADLTGHRSQGHPTHIGNRRRSRRLDPRDVDQQSPDNSHRGHHGTQDTTTPCSHNNPQDRTPHGNRSPALKTASPE